MSTRDAEMEARLRAKAESAIAKALAQRKLPAEATLADIEQVALQAGREVEQAIAQALAEESAAELPAWPNCPQWVQALGRASIVRSGDSIMGRSALAWPAFAPRWRRRLRAGAFGFWSRDGGCDELREVGGGRFRRSTSACNWRTCSANCKTRVINSSRDRSRRFSTVGSVMLPTITPDRVRGCARR
jgi:hypothetical protein